MSTPAFTPKVLDPRTGAIHVPTIDIDKDGKPDFIALLAQQHESVIAFVNRGKGLEFTPKIIYEAPHPNWGSSGIDLVDLDKDGNLVSMTIEHAAALAQLPHVRVEEIDASAA